MLALSLTTPSGTMALTNQGHIPTGLAYQLWTVDASRSFFAHAENNWHLLDCRYQLADWIETHDPEMWRLIGEPWRARYAVRDDLMTVILLRGNRKELYE